MLQLLSQPETERSVCPCRGLAGGVPVIQEVVEPAEDGEGRHAVLGSSTVQVDQLVVIHHQSLDH